MDRHSFQQMLVTLYFVKEQYEAPLSTTLQVLWLCPPLAPLLTPQSSAVEEGSLSPRTSAASKPLLKRSPIILREPLTSARSFPHFM